MSRSQGIEWDLLRSIIYRVKYKHQVSLESVSSDWLAKKHSLNVCDFAWSLSQPGQYVYSFIFRLWIFSSFLMLFHSSLHCYLLQVFGNCLKMCFNLLQGDRKLSWFGNWRKKEVPSLLSRLILRSLTDFHILILLSWNL